MNLFIVGDVHGCYYSFLEVLQHWKPAEELLLQVGDLVDRGRFAPETVQVALELSEKYPAQTVFLKGNHEAGMLLHYGPTGPHPNWLSWGGRSTKQQYQLHPGWLAPHLAWLSERPLFWENEQVLVSHAGLADTPDPMNENNPDGILWRRGPLRNVGKLQVIGHTPTKGAPAFDAKANALYIDTGACFGQGLSAVRISAAGQQLETIFVPTHQADVG
ncbi:hypothetical protein PK28_12705 [Hymenobacter sp. DG25B]|jgi:serine/threonine protein phosphatase 1|uniref:metallophosphoesterase family protein n=1 Tax=Hymenobacter sp. DG25B TaxID=1385664 RepID=UPI000540D275|nr:metallophosphoesterase family protein [Hymenobacter sp. DG25B]AIZ64325.1 hypothetical protein PK28_12705 [Hymenobacter sp. DG25B]